jgi:hypothetical protein
MKEETRLWEKKCNCQDLRVGYSDIDDIFYCYACKKSFEVKSD